MKRKVFIIAAIVMTLTACSSPASKQAYYALEEQYQSLEYDFWEKEQEFRELKTKAEYDTGITYTQLYYQADDYKGENVHLDDMVTVYEISQGIIRDSFIKNQYSSIPSISLHRIDILD